MCFIAEGSMKLIVLFSLLTTSVFAEPPAPGYSPYGRIALKLPSSSSPEASGIVSQRLLNRVADILSRGGDDGSQNEPQENEGLKFVDSQLFDRIARIINQNEGQTAGLAAAPSVADQPAGGLSLPSPSDSYGAPSADISAAYGAPPPQVRKLAATIELGRPEPARRIASFDFQDDEDQNSQNSVSSGYSAPSTYSSDSYPSSLPGGGGLGRIEFISAPQTAERIAAFDLSESPNQPTYSAPQLQEGYQRSH